MIYYNQITGSLTQNALYLAVNLVLPILLRGSECWT